ncbi:MAG: hypothetical protein U0236_21990 [Nitrospira sp.]
MILARRLVPDLVTQMLMVSIAMGLLVSVGVSRSEACTLSPEHGGLSFPVERVDPVWTCTLDTIIQGATTETKVGPIRTALSEPLYRYLLDHPSFTAALIRRLHLGLYQVDMRGPGTFWADDGEGTKGLGQLVYEDSTSRIYLLEGTHESRFLPHVTGKAVVFLRMDAVRDVQGDEAMASTMVAYTRLDNRVLSGLVSLLHPLVSRIVTSRLQKGVETVDRLGKTMKHDPQRVLSVAEQAPALPDQHVAFLKQRLGSRSGSESVSPDGRAIP